jgi:shikimate kinase
MSSYKRIFIIGHPGAGKALLAKTLAEKLGWQFIDIDLGLEFRVGRILPEIIGKQGENAFHDCESEILATQLLKENIVVTTDPAIVCSEKNRQLLSSEFVVYLKVSIPVQIERTLREPTPLLSDKLSQFLEDLHQERDSLYEQLASVSINSDDSALEKHVLRIVNIVLESNDKKHPEITLDKKDGVIFHKNLHTPVQLSDKQAKCLKLLAQGKTSKEIAHQMNMSYRTVEDYIAKMIVLLGCSSSKELIALYYDQP